MKIIWTKHAKKRQNEWERKKGIIPEVIEEVLSKPDQIVKGDGEILIAQSRKQNGLLRVLFLNLKGGKKIITIYWTSKIEKYWSS